VSEDVLQKIHEVADRARKAAEEAERRRDPPPPPPRHWQEEAEDRREERAAIELDMGNLAARGTACARLRALLADGAWHSALELVQVGGLRYGGRLYEIRRGDDGSPPLDVETAARCQGRRQLWFYRVARRSEP
jgi:hypothetical protein